MAEKKVTKTEQVNNGQRTDLGVEDRLSRLSPKIYALVELLGRFDNMPPDVMCECAYGAESILRDVYEEMNDIAGQASKLERMVKFGEVTA